MNKATLTIDMKPRKERSKQVMVEGKIRELLRDLPGARVSVGRGSSGEKLELTLASDDSQLLESTAAVVEKEIRALKGVGNVKSGLALQRPEIA